MLIHTAIVENEPNQIDIIGLLCKRFSQEKSIQFDIKSFSNGFDLLESKSDSFDLVFMDIDMPGMNGMETAEKLRSSSSSVSIVFVTNLPQFAISGYKVGALDFLLKPVTYADFSLAMERFIKLKASQDHGNVVINIHGEITKYRVDEINYLELINHDITIHFVSKSPISFRGSMKEIERSFENQAFFKCNSGIIVNLYQVESFTDDIALMSNSARLIVSRTHRKEMMEKLTALYSESIIGNRK